MPVECRRRGLPAGSAIENFEHRFREAFGREMTPDERRYFYLSGILLGDKATIESDDAVPAGS